LAYTEAKNVATRVSLLKQIMGETASSTISYGSRQDMGPPADPVDLDVESVVMLRS
jgi:hypothetical protein